MAHTLIFLLKKKCEQLLHLLKLLSFFSKNTNTYELDIVLTRKVNILTTNELVKQTMLKLGPVNQTN